MKKNRVYYLILAVETSCDETGISIVGVDDFNDDLREFHVFSNAIVSQVLEQTKYNGVFPGLASKLHVANLEKVFFACISEFFKSNDFSLKDISHIAYTEKPGLEICLQVGKIFAETLSLYLKIPIVPTNHLKGHVYSNLLEKKPQELAEWKFPIIAFILSGGHTQIFYIENYSSFKLIGKTLDDSVGEFLDKSSVMMGFSYPGGPVIEELAKNGKNTLKLPIPKLKNKYDFSFSGLKTKVSLLVEQKKIDYKDLSFAIQNCVFRILKKKIINLINDEKLKFRTIAFGGGVIINHFLRKNLIDLLEEVNSKRFEKISLFLPSISFCTDNAAMIAVSSFFEKEEKK